eukprot:TRINITY_DN111820_c0_g1_i1.p1 TRINITY_DN111820_c0_g1~~TRINITY_DN111820_c0_g1_i1.p1  ORF type:complete len:348 (-),score=69.16 TRINITY_DN111820_c0_g1_i1:40-1083(-)
MRLGGEERREPPPRPPPAGDGGIEIVRGVRISLPSVAILVGAVVAVAVLLYGFGTVEITEFALCASMLTRKVEHKTYTSGRYWIGPLNYFIAFPSVVKTIQFSDSKFQSDLSSTERGDPLLRSRTHDGLDVTIELSFQYQLKQDSLYDLYTTLGEGANFHNTFVRISIDKLTEIATLYTANEFFTDRTAIGKKMEEALRTIFESQLFATIFSFQLRAVGLPDDFEKAIQLTEVKKQDVHVAEAEQNTTRVALETELMQAIRRTKVTWNNAEAYAQSVMLQNAADIEAFTVGQEKAADSYGQVLEKLDSKETELLKYVQTRVLREHPGDKTTIGLNMPLSAATPVAAA